uniref:Transmembrane protein n=1 Tax=Caenorhabditis tropicalis TaxID=1561998 RepID=A0A1I7U083_9PELO
MGICLVLTGIVALAAILACILLLICVKFASDRDERRAARNKVAAAEAEKEANVDGISAISGNTAATSYNNDERAALTHILVVDENDI